MTEEHVILVNEDNDPIGTHSKHEIHGERTPLHRGFSVFIFDSRGRFLIQQRSGVKQTWPLVWSNSCCGHPQMGETYRQAVERRLAQELGMQGFQVHEVLPDYRYQAVYDGVMENEFCPVWAGWTSSEPVPDESEVAATRWIDWNEFLHGITEQDDHPYKQFSQWSREEAVLLRDSPLFRELWDAHVVVGE